jgi:hypothetical protein
VNGRVRTGLSGLTSTPAGTASGAVVRATAYAFSTVR